MQCVFYFFSLNLGKIKLITIPAAAPRASTIKQATQPTESASAAAMIGARIFCAGLSLFMFFGCVAASRGILRLTKKAILAVKSRFVGKESEK